MNPGTTTTTEVKPEAKPTILNDDGTPKVEAKPEVKPEAKPTAPEKYEFTAPEGFELREEAIAKATPIFKELGLTNEQAQKLVTLQSEFAKEAAEAPYAAYDAMRQEWQGKVKADPEIGGILPKVKETIGRALDSIGSPELVAEFKSAMDLTGAGDHPAFVKAFYKLAQAVTEGKHVSGSGPSPHGQSPSGKTERPSAASAMYPNLNK